MITSCPVARAIFREYTEEEKEARRAEVRELYLSDAIIEAKALVAKALKDEWLVGKVTGFGPIAATDHTDPDYPCPVVVLQTKDGLMEVVDMGDKLGLTACYRPVDEMVLIES